MPKEKRVTAIPSPHAGPKHVQHGSEHCGSSNQRGRLFQGEGDPRQREQSMQRQAVRVTIVEKAEERVVREEATDEGRGPIHSSPKHSLCGDPGIQGFSMQDRAQPHGAYSLVLEE